MSRPRWNLVAGGVRVSVLFAVATITMWLGAPTAMATLPDGSPSDQGDVVIVDGAGRPLSGAGSADVFGVRLPEGATCPGDSMHDQWRIQSFMVPSGVDLGTLQYTVIGPGGQDQFSLRTTAHRAFTDQNLAPNSGPGLPGIPQTLPTFTFVRFPPGLLPEGTYRVGLACTLFRETAWYWDTELVITADPSDEPAGFRWTASAAASDAVSLSPSTDGSSPWGLVLFIGVLGAAVAAFVWWSRHRAASKHTPSRSSS